MGVLGEENPTAEQMQTLLPGQRIHRAGPVLAAETL
jgi:hypothetical protein